MNTADERIKGIIAKQDKRKEIILQEDLRKIHTEINNINIHRLVILVGAFALISSTYKIFLGDSNRSSLFYMGEIILLSALFILYLFDRSIRESQLQHVAYLLVNEKSVWEQHNNIYEDRNPKIWLERIIYYPFGLAYTFLGFVVFIYLWYKRGYHFDFFGICLIYILLIIWLSRKKKNSLKQYCDNWRKVDGLTSLFNNDKNTTSIWKNIKAMQLYCFSLPIVLEMVGILNKSVSIKYISRYPISFILELLVNGILSVIPSMVLLLFAYNNIFKKQPSENFYNAHKMAAKIAMYYILCSITLINVIVFLIKYCHIKSKTLNIISGYGMHPVNSIILVLLFYGLGYLLGKLSSKKG